MRRRVNPDQPTRHAALCDPPDHNGQMGQENEAGNKLLLSSREPRQGAIRPRSRRLWLRSVHEPVQRRRPTSDLTPRVQGATWCQTELVEDLGPADQLYELSVTLKLGQLLGQLFHRIHVVHCRQCTTEHRNRM